jgi:outer membrane lipoprotein SlyB
MSTTTEKTVSVVFTGTDRELAGIAIAVAGGLIMMHEHGDLPKQDVIEVALASLRFVKELERAIEEQT